MSSYTPPGGQDKALIYVAGAYNAPTRKGIEDNIRAAEVASLDLISNGWAVFTPHKNSSGYEKYSFSNETWMGIDISILRRCDAVFALRSWRDSPGATREVAEATYNRIPVIFEEDTLAFYCTPPEGFL
ncbi:MAG: DUF4406 domain-containing protein [Methanosarcinaceae archaeon]